MSVYRELAAELRANKAVIDSLNSRNQQLIQQNQRLKQEIHNVVQATLNLGQFAGVARPAEQADARPDLHQEFPSAIAPDTLAKLVRAQGEARKVIPQESVAPKAAPPVIPQDYIDMPAVPTPPTPQPAAPRRKPRPIQKAAAPAKSPDRAPAPRKQVAKAASKVSSSKAASKTPSRAPAGARNSQRADAIVPQAKPLPKLFTEQTGEYRHAALSSEDEKEIGGIWLALSIILIIVTAFGAGFLIMKPLLNDR